jgi:hypothetical protein
MGGRDCPRFRRPPSSGPGVIVGSPRQLALLPGTVLFPSLPLRRDFAELTAANELDIMQVNSDLRTQYGPGLLRLFTSWRKLLSDPAWRAVQMTLP